MRLGTTGWTGYFPLWYEAKTMSRGNLRNTHARIASFNIFSACSYGGFIAELTLTFLVYPVINTHKLLACFRTVPFAWLAQNMEMLWVWFSKSFVFQMSALTAELSKCHGIITRFTVMEQWPIAVATIPLPPRSRDRQQAVCEDVSFLCFIGSRNCAAHLWPRRWSNGVLLEFIGCTLDCWAV